MATKTPKKIAVETKKITDVDKPGTQKPDDTARPIIVGHKGVLLDPMVAGGKTKAPDAASPKQEDDAEKITVKTTKAEPLEIKILPDTDSETETQPDNTEKPAETAAAVLPKKEAPAPAETKEAPSEAEEDEPEAKEEQQAPEPVNEESPEDIDEKNEEDLKKAEASKAESNASNDEAIKRLVESKQYFLPIKKSRHNSGHGVSPLVVGLLFVLLIGGVYAVLDAQVIKNSVPLPYHLFKNISRP